jgi:thiamine-monophosphate kinase
VIFEVFKLWLATHTLNGRLTNIACWWVGLAVEVLGEREIIKLIRSRLELPPMPIEFGDDVSAISLDKGVETAILKTDMLVASSDVPAGMSLFEAARKAVVMNVSDFAAKGAKPQAILVSLGLPRSLANETAVLELADGLNSGAREYGAYVVGGDTSEACDLIISISLFGTAKKKELIRRDGAKIGDVLAVTGLFGKSSAGLHLLNGENGVSDSARKVLLDAVLMPKARLAEGLALAECGGVSASIDSSDGLAWSLHELSKMSSVGFALERVPIAAEAEEFAKAYGFDALRLALYGGEEYELVITVKPELWSKAQSAVAAVGGLLIPIGKATAGRQIVLGFNGEKRVEARGWEHFKSEP